MFALGIYEAARRSYDLLAGQYFISEDRLEILAKPANARVGVSMLSAQISNPRSFGRMLLLQVPQYRVLFRVMAAIGIVAEVVRNTMEQIIVGIGTPLEQPYLVIQHT
jgi:hypothetical protein